MRHGGFKLTLFFSKTAKTFFDDAVCPVLPEDAEVISALDHAVIFLGVAAGKGIDFSGDRPALIDMPGPTDEQYRETALSQRDQGLSVAVRRIDGLQDVVNAGRATEEEIAVLEQWRNYRIDLMRIEQQEGFPVTIVWPLSPDAAINQ